MANNGPIRAREGSDERRHVRTLLVCLGSRVWNWPGGGGYKSRRENRDVSDSGASARTTARWRRLSDDGREMTKKRTRGKQELRGATYVVVVVAVAAMVSEVK
ncbi:hypothetical protein BKA81DRAFT_353508 [Phyllosticta paracitricarpa]